MNNLREMLAKEQIYCATAYFNALSIKFPLYKPAYEQLAYAVNDPGRITAVIIPRRYIVFILMTALFLTSTLP